MVERIIIIIVNIKQISDIFEIQLLMTYFNHYKINLEKNVIYFNFASIILSVPDESYSRNALCTLNLISTFLLVRKDMDVNEHERLSNITLLHKIKEQCFY